MTLLFIRSNCYWTADEGGKHISCEGGKSYMLYRVQMCSILTLAFPGFWYGWDLCERYREAWLPVLTWMAKQLAAVSATSSMAAAVRKLIPTWIHFFPKNFITEHDMPLSSVQCYFRKFFFTNAHHDNSLIISLPIISYLTEVNKHVAHGVASLSTLGFLQVQDLHWHLTLVRGMILISMQF